MTVVRFLLRVTTLAWPWVLAAVVGALWMISSIRGTPGVGLEAGRSFASFLGEMALVLPPMFVLVALFDAWVPREAVERRVGAGAGFAAVPWMIGLAMLQAGPLYVAFPVAISLWRKGCAPRNVFLYLGAFSTMKIPLLTFEVGFLGWPFSLTRTLLSVPVFFALALVLERLLPPGFTPPGLGEPAEPSRSPT